MIGPPDPLGNCILSYNSKLKKDFIRIQSDAATATYCLTLTDQGDLNLGLGDMAIHQSISGEHSETKWEKSNIPNA